MALTALTINWVINPFFELFDFLSAIFDFLLHLLDDFILKKIKSASNSDKVRLQEGRRKNFLERLLIIILLQNMA